MDSILKGCITELKCKLYFMEIGYTVSTPENPMRYDFILDTGKKLFRVQVKTAVFTKEKLTITTNSTRFMNGRWEHMTYGPEEIDYFCTWADGKCYLIPISECSGQQEKSLRFEPAKNGQIKRVSFAKDYLAEDVLERLKT